MSDDKQYPLSENKKKELRKRGVVPFSPLVIPAALVAGVYFLLSESMESGNLTTGFSKFLFEHYFELNPYEILLLIKNYLLKLSFYSIVLLFVSLGLGLLQTAFLFLPMGRYPEGVRLTGRKKNISTIYTQSIGASTMIILMGALVFFTLRAELILSNTPIADDLPSFMANKFHGFISLLNTLPAFLVTISVLAFISSKIRYYTQHKMSRDEILAEGEEKKPGTFINNPR